MSIKASLNIIITRSCHAFLNRLQAFSLVYASKCLRAKLGAVGQNTQLALDLQVDFADRIRIGDWVYIGSRGQFYGRGGLTIGDHVIMGPHVTIMTSMHNYKDARLIPYDEVELLNPVEIGVASWIGFGVIVMPGVVLGKGCIVGAGSVVTKAFPDGSIIAGNPAKIISMRDMAHFCENLANNRTYLKNKVFHKLEKVERLMSNVRKPSSTNE